MGVLLCGVVMVVVLLYVCVDVVVYLVNVMVCLGYNFVNVDVVLSYGYGFCEKVFWGCFYV